MRRLPTAVLGPLFLALSLSALLATAPASVQAGPFDAEEDAAIREIVRDYLLENPEVIYEALQVLQAREEQAQAERQSAGVRARAAELDDPGMLPVLGNPDGDVTLVEFFDYRCGFCRAVADDVMQVVEADGNVRLIMREFPILGEDSLDAARVALATAKQGVYPEFHMALMTEVSNVNEARALALAEDMGLDMDRLRADMQRPEINAELRRSYRLAEALDINGTPAFVVGGRVVPGALQPERLAALIADARERE